MRAVRSFLRFWWDFVVGDDGTVAAGVALALVATAVLARTHAPAWWLLPAAVVALLTVSLARAARRGRRG